MTPAQPQPQQPPPRPGPRKRRGHPPAEAAVPPERVWATLSPSLQAHLRQTLLRITQEVLHDTRHR